MDKEIIIVDSLDKVIGRKLSIDLSSKDIFRETILWITNSQKGILLAKRNNLKDKNSKKWGPTIRCVVENGETYYSSIIKKSREELGLADIYPVKSDRNFFKGKVNFFSQWYMMSTNNDIEHFKVDKSKIKELKWFKKDDIIKKLKSTPSEFTDSVKLLIKK